MESINAFEYSKLKLLNENPPKVISWITILILFVILGLFFSVFFQFYIFSTYTGYIDTNDDYNIRVVVDKDIFPIKDNYELYIDNKKYDYEIINIDYYNGYYEVFIDCNLDDEILVNNNIVTVRFQKYKTTLIKEFIKKIRKGLM